MGATLAHSAMELSSLCMNSGWNLQSLTSSPASDNTVSRGDCWLLNSSSTGTLAPHLKPGRTPGNRTGAAMPVSSKFALLAAILIIVGCGLLTSVLLRLQRLYLHAPLRIVRTRQYPAAALLLVCMAAYLAYLFSVWHTQRNWHDLIMPAVLCGAAAAMWLICTFTLQPALNQLLQQESISDPLLGIYNHHHIERRLVEEVARAQRYNTPLSVFLLDVDHLAQ